MIEVKGYICEHCKVTNNRVKKVFATKSGVTRHENHCFSNPIRKACITCSLWQDADLPYGLSEDPFGVYVKRQCLSGHDILDTGMGNGSIHDAAPQADCKHWIIKDWMA